MADLSKLEIIKTIADIVYPVGSIYISANSVNPQTLFGGSWERIGAGRTLIDCGDSYIAGTKGGSADSVVPYHTHTFTGSSVTTGENSVGHTHSFTTGNPSANHTHTSAGSVNQNVRNTAGKTSISNDYGTAGNAYITTSCSNPISKNNYLCSFSGAQTGTVSAWHTHSGTTNGVSANHTHNVTATGTNSYAGTENNSVGANMPPYLAVYMWKRIA